jgi:hypothetical protein
MNEKSKAILLLLVAISIAVPVCAAQPPGHGGDSSPGPAMDAPAANHQMNDNHIGDFNRGESTWTPNNGDKLNPQWNRTKKEDMLNQWNRLQDGAKKNPPEKDAKKNSPKKDDKWDKWDTWDDGSHDPWWYRYTPEKRMPWLQPWWWEPHNHVWRR